ncbi:unnamed protein product [Triticum turgidum subsp. durum]|uniref:Uncharacterized protein n=1 Tax=Triticum turgidum subsp. durum TaxID=4567 RepID=A0A9R0ZYK9_TRITD|nr:unnamed protein product [Triticum turgidum subsp. durum]
MTMMKVVLLLHSCWLLPYVFPSFFCAVFQLYFALGEHQILDWHAELDLPYSVLIPSDKEPSGCTQRDQS